MGIRFIDTIRTGNVLTSANNTNWMSMRAELALEHVEEKAHMTLSRQIGTPNIVSKGKLEPRTVLMPRSLVEPGSAPDRTKPDTRASPLIQEISTDSGPSKDNYKKGGANGSSDKTNESSSKSSSTNQRPLKSILKPSTASSSFAANAGNAAEVHQRVGRDAPISHSGGVFFGSGSTTPAGVDGGKKKPLIEEISSVDSNDTVSAVGPDLDVHALPALPPLRWKWSKEGEILRIEVDTPGMVRSSSTHVAIVMEF